MGKSSHFFPKEVVILSRMMKLSHLLFWRDQSDDHVEN